MTTPTPDDEYVKAQVSKELENAKTLAKTLNFEEVKSGEWFIKLLQQIVRAYDRNARATYFQKKYPGLPPDEIADILTSITVKYAAIAGAITGVAATASEITAITPTRPTPSSSASSKNTASTSTQSNKPIRRENMKKSIIAILLLVALLSACNSLSNDEIVQTALAETEQFVPSPTETQVPTSTFTRRPTAEPTATNTKIPTLTKQPTRTTRPTNTKVVIEPVVCEGSDANICEIPNWPGVFIYAEFTYTGSRNFVVWLTDDKGNNEDLIVNDIGPYHGRRPINWYDDGTHLAIERGTGSWSIKFDSIDNILFSSLIEERKVYEGQGPDIAFAVSDDSTKGTFSCDTKGNFIVKTISSDGNYDLLINEIAPYTGTYFVDDPFVFDVICDGNWTILLEK